MIEPQNIDVTVDSPVRLRRITIKHFRAIAEATIDFEDVAARCLLVRQVGIGSSIGPFVGSYAERGRSECCIRVPDWDLLSIAEYTRAIGSQSFRLARDYGYQRHGDYRSV